MATDDDDNDDDELYDDVYEDEGDGVDDDDDDLYDDLNDDDLLSDRQFKRLRENYQLCPVDQCKDKNGNWTKWVLERMDEA